MTVHRLACALVVTHGNGRLVPGVFSTASPALTNVVAVLLPVFQMKKLRLRQIKVFGQGKRLSGESDSAACVPGGPSFFTVLHAPTHFLTWSSGYPLPDHLPGQDEWSPCLGKLFCLVCLDSHLSFLLPSSPASRHTTPN